MKLPSLGWNVGTIALGAAAVFFGPALLGVAGNLARTVVKTGIKGGLLLYEKGKEIAAEAKESVEDLAAEAKSEVTQTKQLRTAKK